MSLSRPWQRRERPESGFYVWNPEAAPPRVLHHDAESAKREAKRLAALQPGQTFIILATVGSFCLPAPQPEWVEMLPDLGVPF